MTNTNQLTGKFSPSRLKSLDCLWMYELQYNRKIYPVEDVRHPSAILGSLFHYIAEHWGIYITNSNVKQLIAAGCKINPITEDQIPKLDKMVSNFEFSILPTLLNPYEGDNIISTEVEVKLTGNLNLAGGIDFAGNHFTYSFPINISIDRLIKLESGKVIIIDYKTGGQPSLAPHLFQMLFYAYAYSQKHRAALKNLEIWLVFPDAPNNKFIYKLSGEEIFNHIKDFEDTLLERLKTIEQGPFEESVANVGQACRFCKYKATELCTASQMMFGAEFPNNKYFKFKTGWPPNERIVDPIKIKGRLE